MSKNNSQGAVRLAAVLQQRMKRIKNYDSGITAELGEIGAESALFVDSLPNVKLQSGDYFTLSGLSLSKGNRVLVIWTANDEPVVVGKIG
jgi:hypothetical protein